MLSSPVPVTIVVPTRNESGNIAELVTRLSVALTGQPVEILFVDDSTDDTPAVIRTVAATADLPVRLIHREVGVGGLAGAVTAGIRHAHGSVIVVMDSDLQHPPETVPLLLAALDGHDLVVASRYCGQGDAAGLSSSKRRAVSSASTLLARSSFPRRVGGVCTDPMTGFFALRTAAVDLDRLRPRGFKILLEILARHDLDVVEVPFVFADRFDGESKASWLQGLAFVQQMVILRTISSLDRVSRPAPPTPSVLLEPDQS